MEGQEEQLCTADGKLTQLLWELSGRLFKIAKLELVNNPVFPLQGIDPTNSMSSYKSWI